MSLGITDLVGFGSGGRKSFRYFRLDVTANDGGAVLEVDEIKIFSYATDHPTSAMTSDVLPSPLVASASSAAASQEAFRAFDNAAGTANSWRSNVGTTGWVQIDLGAGNEIAANELRITGAAAPTESPKDFTLEGSNTGAWTGEEIVLLTRTGETGWSASEERTYIF